MSSTFLSKRGAVECHVVCFDKFRRVFLKMFEHLLSSIKNQSSNLSDNIKSKSKKLSYNLSALKNRFSTKGNKHRQHYLVSQKNANANDSYDDNFLSPRACFANGDDVWPSISDNMEWVPFVPPSVDEQNILERFMRVITINDDPKDVRFEDVA